MFKNSSETTKSLEPEKDLGKIIKDSLELELRKMKERSPARNDVKFRVLKRFVSELEGQSFEDAFNKLSKPHKHAIITRLENQAEHMGGSIPYDFINTLEQELYGVAWDEGGEYIDFKKKVELENELQSGG